MGEVGPRLGGELVIATDKEPTEPQVAHHSVHHLRRGIFSCHIICIRQPVRVRACGELFELS